MKILGYILVIVFDNSNWDKKIRQFKKKSIFGTELNSFSDEKREI